MADDRRRCLEAGMDGFLAKPVSTQHLYNLLEGLRSPGQGGLAAQAGDGNAPT